MFKLKYEINIRGMMGGVLNLPWAIFGESASCLGIVNQFTNSSQLVFID